MKTNKWTVYAERGVSPDKADVHKAVAKLSQGLFPTAFCKILPDVLAGSPNHCNILHADTAGTLAGLVWLVWKTTGNLEAVKSASIAALVMNTDDVACVGAVDNFLVNQTVGRNSFVVPAEVLEAVIAGAQEFCDMLASLQIKCVFAGGETADVPDIVRTLDVGSSLAVRMKRSHIIDAGRMEPGDYIIGLSSTGTAEWEKGSNSGIGANGLTNARHDLLRPLYRSIRDSHAPQMRKGLAYRGPFKFENQLPETRFTIAEALNSPTRTYLPIVKDILRTVGRKHIKGIIHCSGGGQTKIGKFGPAHNRYVKHTMSPVPRLFETIQKVSGLTWWEMYKVFNMGHRMEFIVPDAKIAQDCIDVSFGYRVPAQVVGHIEVRPSNEPERVFITLPHCPTTVLKY